MDEPLVAKIILRIIDVAASSPYVVAKPPLVPMSFQPESLSRLAPRGER